MLPFGWQKRLALSFSFFAKYVHNLFFFENKKNFNIVHGLEISKKAKSLCAHLRNSKKSYHTCKLPVYCHKNIRDNIFPRPAVLNIVLVNDGPVHQMRHWIILNGVIAET